MLKLRIDPWGAEYEGGLQLPAEDDDLHEVPAEVDLAVEQEKWEAVLPGDVVRPRLVFVDGVRRVEMRLLADLDGAAYYGLFGALAAGAVTIAGRGGTLLGRPDARSHDAGNALHGVCPVYP